MYWYIPPPRNVLVHFLREIKCTGTFSPQNVLVHFQSALETHASPDALLASPLLYISHVPSETLVGIVAGAACFEYGLSSRDDGDAFLGTELAIGE